jgi:hypothetical protein
VKTSTFDAMTRHAASVSRRGTFRLASAAALAGALATPAASGEGKAGKKSRHRCKKQRGKCLAYAAKFCEPKAEPQSCQAALSPCCAHFARCAAGQGIECFIEAILVG